MNPRKKLPRTKVVETAYNSDTSHLANAQSKYFHFPRYLLMIYFLSWMYRVLVIQLLIQSMCISPSASEKNTVSPGTTQFGADFDPMGLQREP